MPARLLRERKSRRAAGFFTCLELASGLHAAEFLEFRKGMKDYVFLG
jgi:hypothetical protein